MRRSKGFILAEILISMMLQAGFVIVLCGAFYLLVSFESDVQQILTARARGQRVIQYIDQRIRNAGLGFEKLRKISEVQNALSPFTEGGDRALYPKKDGENSDKKKLRLPVALEYSNADVPYTGNDKPNPHKNEFKNERGNSTQWGNILTLLYAKRNTDNGVNLVVTAEVNTDVDVEDESSNVIGDYTYKFISGENEINKSECEFNKSGDSKKMNAWGVMAGTGVPFVVSYKSGKISFDVFPANTTLNVYTGDELLYLKCEKMFAAKDNDGERNFYVQELKDGNKWTDWTAKQPYQNGILGLYFELDTKANILDLWVLASGGKDGKYHERALSWPTHAYWKNNVFNYYVVYVSHASWKLENIPEVFNWNS